MNNWSGTRIVRGRPRHPQSQGLIERGNSILKNKLSKWMQRNRSTLWSQGLDHVMLLQSDEIYALRISFWTEAKSKFEAAQRLTHGHCY